VAADSTDFLTKAATFSEVAAWLRRRAEENPGPGANAWRNAAAELLRKRTGRKPLPIDASVIAEVIELVGEGRGIFGASSDVALKNARSQREHEALTKRLQRAARREIQAREIQRS
jgi:hypothetical protein